MLQEIGIVALREVFAEMRAPALLAGQRAFHQHVGQVYQDTEFENFQKLGIILCAPVLNLNLL